MGDNDATEARVQAYLRSAAGEDTPTSIAARLFALDPASFGMRVPPTLAQLHVTRLCLQDLAAEQRPGLAHTGTGELTWDAAPLACA